MRDDPEIATLLADARALAGRPDFDTPRTIRLLQDWIDADKKATPLKTLQGLIWDDGFRRGELVGDVYADVPPALRRWRDAGIKLYVYSSGSVQAQRLVFGYTPFGDLTPLFSGYFDTRVGSKLEQTSYRVIAAAIDTEPGEILFLSDAVGELDAAQVGRPAHHGARPRRGGAAGAASASGCENLRRRGAAGRWRRLSRASDAMMPQTISSAATTRQRVTASPSENTEIAIANRIDVSRNAATEAIGAWVIAHTAIQ